MSNPELDSVQPIAAMSFDLTTLVSTSIWVALNGPGGFSDNIKMLKIYNGSAINVDISFDGVNKHDYWPSGATIIFDFQTNHQDAPPYGSGTLYGRAGQIIWAKLSTTNGQLQMAGFR